MLAFIIRSLYNHEFKGKRIHNVLPFGAPEDVRKEVRMLLKTLGAGKEGFICASCHNIQAGTPVDNILAMIDEVKIS